METKIPCSIFLFFLSILTALPFLNSIYELIPSSKFKAESSIWCSKTLNHTNACRLKNICYDTEFRALLFFLGNSTVIKGLTNYSELKKIQLSSIDSHNQFYVNVSLIDIENYKFKKQLKIESKALLFSRFKPNNIMHVFHDDLFPLFLTLESVCLGDKNCMTSYKLLIHDHHPKGPFFDFYKIFSSQIPLLLNDVPYSSDFMLCFEEMLVGLLPDSIFYQYGFNKPHGPVTSLLVQSDITRFTYFVKDRMNIKNNNNNVYSNIVLINRSKSRRVLNIKDVKEMVSDVYKKVKQNNLKVFILDLYENDTETFIKSVSNTDVLIGMHGAEMIFSLFMKPKSVVIELFPFGIQPEIVSFARSVSKIEGSNTHYFAWKNIYKNNSVPHPDAHPMFGGINYLDKAIQEEIKNMEKVPPVECCNDPAYLYHMYQDTMVSKDFKNFLYEALTHHYSKIYSENKIELKKWFYPSVVSNVTCKFYLDQRILNISWMPPFNVRNSNNIKYELYIKEKGNAFEKEIITDALHLQVKIPGVVKNNSEFQIWICAYYDINHSKSQDLYLECRSVFS